MARLINKTLQCLSILVLVIHAKSLQAAPGNGPKFVSEYSDLAHCKTVKKSGPKSDMDFISMRCEGHDGYDVSIDGGDARTWLTLKKGTMEIRLPAGEGASTAAGIQGELAFPYVIQAKLEWRYKMEDGRKKLLALIYRMGGAEAKAYFLQGDQKEISLLYIVRLGEQNAQVIGYTKTNEEAHRIADNSTN